MTATSSPIPSSLLQSVLDCSLNGVMVYQCLRDEQDAVVDFRLLSLNKAAETDLGVPARQLVGQTLLTLFPDATQSPVFDQYRTVIETGQSARFEVNHLFPGRSLSTWLDISAVKLDDCLVMSYLDITDRKTNELRLQQQADLYTHALNSTTHGIVLCRGIRDRQQRLIDLQLVLINAAGVQLVGFSREEIMGRTALMLMPDKAYQLFIQQLLGVLETGRELRAERYVNWNNRWYDVQASPYGDDLLSLSIKDITHRKQAEFAREEQHRLLSKVMNTVQSGIMLCQAVRDTNGTIIDFQTTFCNDKCLELTGLSRQQLLTLSMLTIDPAGKHNGIFDHYARVVETGIPLRAENYFGQAQVWLDNSVQKFGDGVVASISDVTALKTTAIKYEQTAARLQNVLDASLTGISMLKPVRNEAGQVIDFIVTLTNEATASATGIPKETITGKYLLSVMPFHQELGLFDRYVSVVHKKQSERFKWHNEQADRWFDISVKYQDDELAVTFLDVTTSKHLQLAHQNQAQLLQGVLDGALNSIIVYDAVRDAGGQIKDFQVVLFNKTAPQFFPIPEEQLRGMRLTDLYPATKERGMFHHCVRVIETGEPYRSILEYPEHSLAVDLSISRFGDGVIVGANDVTDIRRYQRELERSNQELKRSNENLQEFAYVASHDLQEPLRKIQSFGDVLHNQYRYEMPEQAGDLVNRMQKAAHRMQNLIQDLLTYSRISTQQQPFRLVSLNRLVEEVAVDLEMTIQDKQASLTLEPLPDVMGDPVQLRQLFQNLISNSLKFGHPNRPPVISITARPITHLAIPGKPATGQQELFWEISLTDNGIGFDEKYANRIFQLFQRLHGKNLYGGTGIGLPICKKVMDHHKGYITATSRPGEGSVFRIYLPK
ncbi:hypothetical protein GCM10023189_49370 [Nibrella saemangeumensis]|uniref:histidine kinase n=1 Tax=Nibrella saemangeumensis TaxID=1084526 RepID=A0ABP8NJJ4_9BACT